MTELVSRYVKLAILLVFLWTGMWFWTSCGYKTNTGSEMSPTLAPNKNYLVMKRERTPEVLTAGDLVLFEYKHPGREKPFAGRVMALPGQRVRMEKGECLVDGQKVDGGVILSGNKSEESFEEIVVPRDCVYILMDNRKASARYDSRGIGPVGYGAILAKIKK